MGTWRSDTQAPEVAASALRNRQSAKLVSGTSKSVMKQTKQRFLPLNELGMLSEANTSARKPSNGRRSTPKKSGK
jgi:hypothetical protein